MQNNPFSVVNSIGEGGKKASERSNRTGAILYPRARNAKRFRQEIIYVSATCIHFSTQRGQAAATPTARTSLRSPPPARTHFRVLFPNQSPASAAQTRDFGARCGWATSFSVTHSSSARGRKRRPAGYAPPVPSRVSLVWLDAQVCRPRLHSTKKTKANHRHQTPQAAR